MARGAITALKLTTMNSSVSHVPALVTVGSATGAYLDCNNIDASKVIFVFTKKSSATLHNACGDKVIVQHGAASGGYSAYGVGDLTFNLSSDGAASGAKATMHRSNLVFAGPFETARFKDGNGYIKIDPATNCIMCETIGAIFIK